MVNAETKIFYKKFPEQHRGDLSQVYSYLSDVDKQIEEFKETHKILSEKRLTNWRDNMLVDEIIILIYQDKDSECICFGLKVE